MSSNERSLPSFIDNSAPIFTNSFLVSSLIRMVEGMKSTCIYSRWRLHIFICIPTTIGILLNKGIHILQCRHESNVNCLRKQNRMSKTRLCKYECGTELGDFDEKQNKYLEISGTLHTRERCESLKTQTGTMKVETNSKPLSLEELDARLKRVESIVIGPQK